MNRNRGGGVLLLNHQMHATVYRLQVGVNEDRESELVQEFEERLADAGTLATRVAYGVLRNREDAEDVAQEALVKAYQQFRSLRDPARFRSWLVRIVWRLALDHRRTTQRRSRREFTAATMATRTDVEQIAAQHEFEQRLFAAIDALPNRLRLVIVLSGIEGHDTREVAALLGVPEGTVKSRLHAARRRLVELLR